MAQAVSRRPPTVSVHVGFVVEKVALGQVFVTEFFGFPLSVSSFHQGTILIYHRLGEEQ
jgi:hypothetical protein